MSKKKINEEVAGTIGDSFLNLVKEIDETSADNLYIEMLIMDKTVLTRNDMIQKILINRILTSKVLIAASLHISDASSSLALLDLRQSNNVWLSSLRDTVIPFLIKHKRL